MKRSKLFLLSLFSLMLSGTAWAEDDIKASTDANTLQSVYKIHGGRQTQDSYWGTTGGKVTSASAAQFAFISTETTGQYYIYCVSNGTYLTYDQSNIVDGYNQTSNVESKDNAKPWAITKFEKEDDGTTGSYYQMQPVTSSNTAATEYANWYLGTDAYHVRMGFWKQDGSADKGSSWTFEETDCTSSDVVCVTYNYKVDGSETALYTWKYYVTKGSAYPKPGLPSTAYCSSDYYSFSGVPEENVSAADTRDIQLVQNLPFEISTDFDNAKWYVVSLGTAKYKLYYDKDATDKTKMPLSETTTTYEDKHLFCFVGDIVNGFEIYNKSAGKTMLLSSATGVASDNDGSKYVIMTDETTAKAQAYKWDITNSSAISGGLFIGQHEVPLARMNYRGSLAFWFNKKADTDPGSTFTIEAVNVDDATLATIKDLCDKNGQLGYPKASATATTELGSAISGFSADNQTTSQTLRQKYAAYTSCTDVVVPESGKFYTLLCTSGNRYVLSTLSKNESYNTRLATSAEGAASTADCIFYYKDGKYMMGYNDGYFVGETTTNNPFAGHAVAGSTTGSIFSFSSASVSDGSLYVNFQNGSRKLNANDDGYTNAGGSSASGNGYCFKVTEVTELPLTIGSNGWSSFSAPVDVKIPTGVTVYYAKDEPTNGKLLLTELTGGIIPANTGVLVQGEEGTTVNFSTEIGDASATALSDNKLVSNWYVNTVGNSTEETAKTDGLYAFATKTTDGVKTTGFMKLLTAVTLQGHKCYLNAATAASPSSASAQFIPISLTDDPTGIESAETTTASDINAPIYDLQGRKVNGTKKGGMYIQNGKVFIAM